MTDAEVRERLSECTATEKPLYLVDTAFVRELCEDWLRLKAAVREISLLQPICGVEAARILAKAALADFQPRHTTEEPPCL